MSDIVSDLGDLSPEELQKVQNLISKFAGRQKRDSEDTKPRPKRQKKQNHKKQNHKRKDSGEQGKGRTKKRQTIITDESELREPPKQSGGRKGQGRSQPRNPDAQQSRGGRRGSARRGSPIQTGRGGGAKVMARTEQVQLSGLNKFDKMRARTEKKRDTVNDKKLWVDQKGRKMEPTERPDQFQYVEVQCTECQLWYDVSPDLVYRDEDTREIVFTCNGCGRRG